MSGAIRSQYHDFLRLSLAGNPSQKDIYLGCRPETICSLAPSCIQATAIPPPPLQKE